MNNWFDIILIIVFWQGIKINELKNGILDEVEKTKLKIVLTSFSQNKQKKI